MQKPKDLYPGQVSIADAGYPDGKARNIVSEGDGTGTPFEEQWLNDVFGFMQDLIRQADDSPDGVPEQLGTSQLRNALMKATRRAAAVFDISADLSGGLLDVAGANSLFTLQTSAGLVTSPLDYDVENPIGSPADPGRFIASLQPSQAGGHLHLIAFSVRVKTQSVANPAVITLRISDGVNNYDFVGTRWSGNTAHYVPIIGIWAANFNAAVGKQISIANNSGAVLESPVGKLFVMRISGYKLGW